MSFVNQCATWLHAVCTHSFDLCVFKMSCLYRSVIFSVKVVEVKGQRVHIKFCFKLGKIAAKTHKMLIQVFGDDALGQKQTCDWFKWLKMPDCELTVTNVLDGLQGAQCRKMLQKWARTVGE
jgi:hypothetical protein